MEGGGAVSQYREGLVRVLERRGQCEGLAYSSGWTAWGREGPGDGVSEWWHMKRPPQPLGAAIMLYGGWGSCIDDKHPQSWGGQGQGEQG